MRWKCSPDIFEFKSTVDIEPMESTIGQERALEALKIGVRLRSPGYNVYIAGLSGTGKAATVTRTLEAISSDCRLFQTKQKRSKTSISAKKKK